MIWVVCKLLKWMLPTHLVPIIRGTHAGDEWSLSLSRHNWHRIKDSLSVHYSFSTYTRIRQAPSTMDGYIDVVKFVAAWPTRFPLIAQHSTVCKGISQQTYSSMCAYYRASGKEEKPMINADKILHTERAGWAFFQAAAIHFLNLVECLSPLHTSFFCCCSCLYMSPIRQQAIQ